MSLILRYFTELGSFRAALHKTGRRCRHKKFTFAISSPDEFLMVALWNRAHHYFHAVVCSSSFFPRLISAAADWMSAILPHMVWP